MSTTAEQYRILIGGQFADAATGETMEVIGARDRRDRRRGAALYRGGRRPRGRGGAGRAAPLAREDSEGALGAPPQARRRAGDHLLPISSELPHGGYEQSGYGKDMSIYSMEEYTQLKHVAIKVD